MKRILLGFLLTMAWTTCGVRSDSVLKSDYFTIIEHPGELPPSLSRAFHYPGAEPIVTGFYDSGKFFTAQEGVIIFTTMDDRESVNKFFQEAFEQRDWNIIQSRETGEGTLLMAESPVQQLVTVVLRGTPLHIKIYFRRSADL